METKFENVDIPFQVTNIIEKMMDKSESVHIRTNYKMRLIAIRNVIDAAIKKVDNENYAGSSTRGTAKR